MPSPTTPGSPPAVSAWPLSSTPIPPGAGTEVAGLTVRHVDELEQLIARTAHRDRRHRHPCPVAQQVCDRLVAAGVTSILNFAPALLQVPDGVDLRKVDLSIELQILAFHEQRKNGAALALTAEQAAELAEAVRQ